MLMNAGRPWVSVSSPKATTVRQALGDFLVSAYDEEGVCKSNYLIFRKE